MTDREKVDALLRLLSINKTIMVNAESPENKRSCQISLLSEDNQKKAIDQIMKITVNDN